MGLFDRIHTYDEIDNLATQLALLYIEKSTKPISDPKDIAKEFVEAQKAITEELNEFN